MSFAETLALEGIAASIGSIGDAYDNALAESTIGLFKNEAIRDGSPFRTGPLRTIDDVEWITAGWVDWYNARRLHSTIRDVPPDESETAYYADLKHHPTRRWHPHRSGKEPGTVHSAHTREDPA